MVQQAVRIAFWTFGWTVFQGWAVIGWPDTLEGARATLVAMSAGSTLALVGWYGVLQRSHRPRPEG